MADQLASESTWRWTLTIAGRDCGTWMEADGGDKDSEQVKIRPGAGEAEQALPGQSSYDNLTLTAAYRLQFHGDLEPFLDAQVGAASALNATRTPVDGMGIVIGKSRTYVGTLKKVSPPKGNANGSDASTIVVECNVTAVT